MKLCDIRQKAVENHPCAGNPGRPLPDVPEREISRRSPSRIPRIGLALSCGGARGLAHIGVLQVLEENHIPIAAVAGSSMGAYIGSLHALGLSGLELEKLAGEIRTRQDFLRLLDPVLPPMSGLIRGEKLKLHYQRTMGDTTFESLSKPVYIIATDLDSYEEEVFQHGMVADAVHASCCIPGVCAPVVINGRRYVDGGVVNPLPVGILREREDLDAIIAVSVIQSAESRRRSQEREAAIAGDPSRWSQAVSLLNRNLNLLAKGNAVHTLRSCISAARIRIDGQSALLADVVLRPVSTEPQSHDYFRFQKYIELGRQTAEAQLPALLVLLKPSPKPKSHHEHHTPHPMGRCA